MDGTAVKELRSMALENVQVERGGLLFSGKEMKPVFYEPRPHAMELHTLSGLVDFIRDNIDKLELKSLLIMVDSPDRVELVSQLTGIDRKRDTFAEVTIDQGLKTYQFGAYQSIESFVISIRSMFEHSPDLDKLINYVSRINGGKSFELADDGVSQTATVKTGVAGALTAKETAPAIVKLRPYRTFRDIEQTDSEFLFRMKLIDTTENIVGACLYEADGGRWRHFAAQAIQKFLHDELPDGPAVIA